MEELLKNFLTTQSLILLFGMIAVLIFILGRGADMLVEEAVALSIQWGVSKIFIGATIVSLGTTFPEAAVSVFAAFKGEPGIALGNAVGSIICDTGLILGLATVLSPLPLKKDIVNRQGWIQFGAGCLLVIGCLPFGRIHTIFTDGGLLPRYLGLFFLILLVVYLWMSLRWAKQENEQNDHLISGEKPAPGSSFQKSARLLLGILLVVTSSHFLIPAIEVTALRLNVPESIISATLVAFGTSLPELVTAMTSVRKGVGELAVGNVIGADILNVLFVAGAAASVTHPGLLAPPQFFKMLFPAMLLVLVVFRVGIYISGDKMKRSFGVVLLSIYILVTIISYSGFGS